MRQPWLAVLGATVSVVGDAADDELAVDGGGVILRVTAPHSRGPCSRGPRR
jgi:hypothetical protein